MTDVPLLPHSRCHFDTSFPALSAFGSPVICFPSIVEPTRRQRCKVEGARSSSIGPAIRTTRQRGHPHVCPVPWSHIRQRTGMRVCARVCASRGSAQCGVRDVRRLKPSIEDRCSKLHNRSLWHPSRAALRPAPQLREQRNQPSRHDLP